MINNGRGVLCFVGLPTCLKKQYSTQLDSLFVSRAGLLFWALQLAGDPGMDLRRLAAGSSKYRDKIVSEFLLQHDHAFLIYYVRTVLLCRHLSCLTSVCPVLSQARLIAETSSTSDAAIIPPTGPKATAPRPKSTYNLYL